MEEYAREPCPYRIVDDCGGAFAMGCIGGSVFQAIKGYLHLTFTIEFVRICFISIHINAIQILFASLGFRNAPTGFSRRMVSAIHSRSSVLLNDFEQ